MQTQIALNITEFNKLYNQHAQRVLDDTYRLLSSFPSLIPQSDTYYNNEGLDERLLCLTGTVPIMFRGAKYNIPVLVWIPKTYPTSPPKCFVTPTRDMVIKPNHKHVDPNGECGIPYVQFWNSSSNLVELVTDLCGVFSKEPPLFAKSSQTTTSHASFRNTKPLPSPPQISPPTTHRPEHYTPPSYLPPSYTHPSYPPLSHLSPPSTSSSSLPTTRPLTPPPPAVVSQHQQILELQKQVTRKLQQRLEEFFKTTTKDMEMFMSNQSTLETRSTELEKSIQSLKIEESELEKAAGAAIAKNEEMDNWINFMEQPREIDELVLASDPISQQQFAVVSEDHSIDDVLYYLGKGLAGGRIDFDTYLKEVRVLSRHQFFLRALAMKLSGMQEEKSR